MRKILKIGAEVESSNTVGYVKLSTVEGLTLIGVQFQTVGGRGANLSATMVPSGLVGYDWDSFEGGDQMYCWDPAQQGYAIIYTYAGDTVPEWVPATMAGKWMDENMEAVSDPIALGEGVWIESTAQSANIIVLGEVNTNAVQKALGYGLNLVANPYPKALDVNSATYTGLVGFDWDSFEGGDQMYCWDPAQQGYAIIYTYAGDSVPEWVPATMAGKWMDENMEAVSDPIPVGGAVWIESTTATEASVRFTY